MGAGRRSSNMSVERTRRKSIDGRKPAVPNTRCTATFGLAVIVLAIPFLLGSAHAAGASTPQANGAVDELRFEVASIVPHRNSDSAQTGFEENPSFVRMRSLSLRALIRIAYGVMDSQLVGPSWLDSVAFDVTAKPPPGYQSGQLPVLLRNLLADRFKLVIHRDTKEVAGFALRLAPRGHRLNEAKGERTFLTGRPGLIAGNSRSIAELVPLLAQMVAAPVSDQTALPSASRYDLRLEWTPQLLSGGNGTSPEPEVSIFTALREQLGLRLDPVKMAVDVVVVDAAERVPTEN
jgi:uncharacterized protein (TIGR03435 family)